MSISIPTADWVAALAGRRSMPAGDQRALITNALIVGGHRSALVACLAELGEPLPPDAARQMDCFMALRARVEETLLLSGLVCRSAAADSPGAPFAFRGTDDDAERAADALERLLDSYSQHLPPGAPPALADPALRLRLRSLPLVRRASAARGVAGRTVFTPVPCSAALDEAALRACEAHVYRRLNPVAGPILCGGGAPTSSSSAAHSCMEGGVLGRSDGWGFGCPCAAGARGDVEEEECVRDSVRDIYEAAVGSLLSEPLCGCSDSISAVPSASATSLVVVAPGHHKAAACLSPAAVCDAIDAQLLASQGMRPVTHIETMLREIKLREAELKSTRQIIVPSLTQVVPAPRFA